MKGSAVSDLLDTQRLDLIRELDPDGSAGLLVRMIAAFADQAPRQVCGILDAASDGDLESVASLAHTLKSAAANLGAETLRRRVQSIERAAREKQHDELARQLFGLESELRTILSVLQSLSA